jgi:hypothetical protein
MYGLVRGWFHSFTINARTLIDGEAGGAGRR